MDLQKITPIVLYDDQCYLCIKFARFVNFLGREKLHLVGHYSSLGKKLRTEFLDSSALEMFWLIDKKTAYGGRAALGPLLKTILFSKKKNNEQLKIEELCDSECKTAKAVFVRSASLLKNSKKIPL